MTKFIYNRSLVLGGSKGIGKSIAKLLKDISKEVFAFSSKDVDLSNLDSVEKFLKKYTFADILVLNGGGPPNLKFEDISQEIWIKYFKQLFLSHCEILKKIKINDNGYIFYISSSVIKEPDQNLIISSSLRIALSSVLKSLSIGYSKKKISIIKIAPGPFKTDRVKDLIKDISSYEKNLPLGMLGNPDEIGKFVRFIVKNKIKYMTGSTILFDGNLTKSL
jgi:3-oxoacyl-[acyl-carrier protein] reductase